MSTDQLKMAILKVYGTFSECADAIGMSKSQFSKSLTNPSSKFLAKLEEAKVVIERPQEKLSTEIENSSDLIKELKVILYEKNIMIDEQRKIIEQKDKLINQYEELNRAIKENKG